MRTRALIALPAAFATFVLVATGGAARAVVPVAPAPTPPDVHVQAVEDYYAPSTVEVQRGGAVVWDWTGAHNHTATDYTGMDLYDSGVVVPGAPSFSYTFVAAGTYRVICTLHSDVGMYGRVEVPVRVAPTSGPHARSFKVTWSSEAAAPGFAFNVQIQRKGQGWTLWKDGVTTRQDGYRPTKEGTYRFRARMRAVGTGEASGWSEPFAISVH